MFGWACVCVCVRLYVQICDHIGRLTESAYFILLLTRSPHSPNTSTSETERGAVEREREQHSRLCGKLFTRPNSLACTRSPSRTGAHVSWIRMWAKLELFTELWIYQSSAAVGPVYPHITCPWPVPYPIPNTPKRNLLSFLSVFISAFCVFRSGWAK